MIEMLGGWADGRDRVRSAINMSKSNNSNNAEPEQEAAFVMECGDRFHVIIMSDPIRFEVEPKAEAVLTFFIIRRASGTFDIVNVNKTYVDDECISRTVQTKTGIAATAVGDELDNLRINFALGIEKRTGFKLKWNTLDLSGIEDMGEQVSRIKAWGRVGVTSPLNDLPPVVSLN